MRRVMMGMRMIEGLGDQKIGKENDWKSMYSFNFRQMYIPFIDVLGRKGRGGEYRKDRTEESIV
jgi:hypothetical protein